LFNTRFIPIRNHRASSGIGKARGVIETQGRRRGGGEGRRGGGGEEGSDKEADEVKEAAQNYTRRSQIGY